ncbi:hypothetical protein [Pseudoduganella umbonata]|uniref:Uncharacterized protein n=1 Tax=Pseudoduganella umbonata TaxID=864828 RepID=A0A4P8HK84_9BURK|nr:hypothetical protein [Pseudoduganella umbonata]MBB3220160.1 hypothetical protein [Pseudoduganella umbonata]QCP10149.1 hypothetical protein FCL38_06715 [Pseudoduganella umbonata]
MGDRFWNKLWHGTAPLVLWAAHFFFCYLFAASGCRRGTWTVLLAVTLLALAAAGWLCWRAWRESGAAPRGVLRMARLGGAILAFAAIAWSAMPLLAFGGCD